MFQIIGIVLLFGLRVRQLHHFGGNIAVILGALPHEMMAIGGAGTAAFLISNSDDGDQVRGRRHGQACSKALGGSPATTATCSRCCSCSPRP